MALPNFNLIGLPFLPRDRIIRLFRPVDLLSLSKCSKKWEQIVEQKKIGAIYSFKIYESGAVIELEFPSGESLIWNSEHTVPTGSDHRSLLMRILQRGRCYHPISCNLLSKFRSFQKIFPVAKLKNLVTDTHMTLCAANIAQNTELNNWERIELRFDPPKTRSMQYSNIRLSFYPFDGLKAETFWLEMRVSFRENESTEDLLSAKKLYVDYGEWIEDDDLLELDCEIASLRLYRPRFELMNRFINQWLQGCYRKLKYIHVSMCGHQRSTDDMYPVLLNSIEFQNWNGYTRARYYPLDTEIPLAECDENEGTRFDLKDGKDIRRGDGTIATVMITDFDDVYLFVWHNRFPEKV